VLALGRGGKEKREKKKAREKTFFELAQTAEEPKVWRNITLSLEKVVGLA